MGLFSRIPEDQLEKVLFGIFDYLDDQDLLRCETVCRQWREVLLSEKSWRKLFHRKIVSSPQWRQVWRNFVHDENKLQTAHYRSLCTAIIQELKQVDRNWRTGNCRKSSRKVDSISNAQVLTASDHIALQDFQDFQDSRSNIKFLHRWNLKLKSLIDVPQGWSGVTNAEIAVMWDEKNIKILDSDGQLMTEVPELDEDERISVKLVSCCLYDDQLAVLSRTEGEEKLSLWDVRNPTKVLCLKSRLFNLNLQLDYFFSMKMDDQFIAVSIIKKKTANIYFFSKETLGLHWQKTFDRRINRCDFVYDKGMFLCATRSVSEGNLIEMFDVKSGQCFRKLRTPLIGLNKSVCFNSKFMVVVSFDYGVLGRKLKIYDLEDVKNPKSEANELCVLTMDEELGIPSLSVGETEIYITDCGNVMHRLTFGSFEYFPNATKSVTLSSPWRSVWRSKGVDEEPLEFFRHMEVYREVLKYFHRLSMDCQAAIKTYPIGDLNFENFTLGDDFIGYRQCSLKTVIYDENMQIRPQERQFKTLQINKTTYVFVMGKTIQLIDSTTGNVINGTKLERDAINLHFGQNLLVFVCKIREREHLLSVWRVESSLNLNHLGDVAIGDYDGSLQVDEQFIAVETGIRTLTDETYNFISMKTFQVERSLSSDAMFRQYDKGYLFVSKRENLVGILDVASGTFLRDISIKPSINSDMIFRVNSNYVVMANVESKLDVYDLKCLKEIGAVPSHLLLTSFDMECPVKEMLINETRVVCLTNNKMFVVDLKPIDRLRCPEFC